MHCIGLVLVPRAMETWPKFMHPNDSAPALQEKRSPKFNACIEQNFMILGSKPSSLSKGPQLDQVGRPATNTTLVKIREISSTWCMDENSREEQLKKQPQLNTPGRIADSL